MPNMTSDAPMIEARDIRKAFGANQVLRGLRMGGLWGGVEDARSPIQIGRAHV